VLFPLFIVTAALEQGDHNDVVIIIVGVFQQSLPIHFNPPTP
jgi:hypothetical protein